MQRNLVSQEACCRDLAVRSALSLNGYCYFFPCAVHFNSAIGVWIALPPFHKILNNLTYCLKTTYLSFTQPCSSRVVFILQTAVPLRTQEPNFLNPYLLFTRFSTPVIPVSYIV